MTDEEPGWTLRAATDEDAALVASWPESAEEAARWASVTTFPVPAEVVAAWGREADASAYVLCAPDGTPVGYGEVWDDEEEDEAELARLVVEPSRRRRGLGRRLVGGLLDEARETGRGACILRVVPGNTAAQAVYRAAGFVDLDEAEAAAWNQGQPVAYVWMRHPSFG